VAIRWISAEWKAAQQVAFPPTERLYIDFRQMLYPPDTANTLAYTLITSVDNQPGSHNLTGGLADYMIDLPSAFAIRVRALPTCAYDVATDQVLWSWYIDATHRCRLLYRAADDKMVVSWQDGGTERTLESAAYASNLELQVWADFDVFLDLSAGTGAFYIDRVLVDNSFSGAADAKASNFPKFTLRGEAGTAGAFTVNHLRLFDSEAVVADVADDYKGILGEEVYWYLNGEGCGRSRVNVTRFLYSLNTDAKKEKDDGSQCANTLSAELFSRQGEFADDQYAAWDPTNAVYNGTSAQKYMQQRCPVTAETWYGNIFEPIFVGRLDDGMFTRTSAVGDVTTVAIQAEDVVSDIARERKRRARSYSDKKLSDATEADSLVHLIARLATRREVYNYAANSGFENDTIANSWAVAGTGATLARAAGGLFGSYEGQLDYAAATCTATQTVTFLGTKTLNVGDAYNFSLYLKCAGAASSTIRLGENDSGGENAGTNATYTLAGGEGWKKFEVTHTITDATSDRLVMKVTVDDNVTLSMDAVMLVQATRAYNFVVLNNNDGASAIESADDADYAEYDTVGFDCDAVDIVHPFAMVEQGTPVWDAVKDIANATAARYMGCDSAGCLRYRSPFATGYTDPTSLETITSVVSIESMPTAVAANRVIVHGTHIVKSTAIKPLWDLRSSQLWEEGISAIELTDGAQFPDPSLYGEFWAKFGDAQTSNGGVQGATAGAGG
jgi:hypothetical protein